MSTESSSSKKGVIALLLIAAAGGLTYAQIKRVTPSAAINNGHSGDFDLGEGARGAGGFAQIAKEAKITPEQQKKLEELREKVRDGATSDRREMFTKMQDVLTTEQRQTMRESFQARRAEREAKMKAAMGEAEFKRYQDKMRERWGGRGGPGGPGGFRGPGGGPGGPGGQGGNTAR